MDQVYAAVAAAAGGLTIPFIVGYFVHAGARVGGHRVPWAMESRARLIAESSYYFVALLVATSAAAGLAWKLPLPKPWEIFAIQFGAAGAALGAYVLALLLRDFQLGKLTIGGKNIPNSVGEFLALALIWVPVFCWTLIFRTLMERWDLGRAAEDEPLKMSLPLAMLLLTPLGLWTFSFTAQTWGILFAYHRYGYPQATVRLKNATSIEGQLVQENEHDVRLLENGKLNVIARDQVDNVEISVT